VDLRHLAPLEGLGPRSFNQLAILPSEIFLL